MKIIFIGGCPRSGTTLLAGTLGAGSGCLATPESPFLVPVLQRLEQEGVKACKWHVREEAVNNPWFSDWKLPDRCDAPPWKHNRKCSNTAPQDLFMEVVSYFGETTGKKPVKAWIDHTPSSIDHVKKLADFFPEARFIHLVRDPRAVYASMKKLAWGPGSPWSFAGFSRKRITSGIQAEFMYPARVLRCRYEDLLMDPEEQLRRICVFTKIDYNESMLSGGGYLIPERARKRCRLELAHLAPIPSVADRWHDEITPCEQMMLENLLFDIINILGYHSKYPENVKPVITDSLLTELSCRAKKLILRLSYWHLNRR